nr:hypothetical protein [Tanacetum cinerariifolium]
MENTVPNVRPTKSTSTATTAVDLQQQKQLYLRMKSDLQAQVVDLKLWDVLKAKFEKSFAVGSFLDDAHRKRDHDDHQGDDATLEGEKSAKRKKTSK